MRKIFKIYFSPAGTTKKICSAAADALALKLGLDTESYDFTLPCARKAFPQISSEDIAVFAVPTYAGRVPNVLLKYLGTICGGGARTIALVSFGNRDFDSSLAELRDILISRGFRVTAAGAVGCQHAFSNILGKDRPDGKDMEEIEKFIGSVCSKHDMLSTEADTDAAFSLSIPAGLKNRGNTLSLDAYGGYYRPQDRNGNHIDIRKVVPKVSDKCNGCGICAKVCPMGSISEEDVRVMKGICIKCNACLKNCPSSARYFDDHGYLYHKTELEEMYSRRAENSFFL